MASIERVVDRATRKNRPQRELGELLLQADLITEAQLREALVLQRTFRERLASILVRQGVLTEKFAVGYLAKQLGVPPASLSRQQLDLELLQMIPLELCERRMVFPLRVEHGRLMLAMKDPLDLPLVAEIERLRKVRLAPCVALEVSLRHTLSEAREALKAGRWTVTPNVHRVVDAAPSMAAKDSGKLAFPSLAVETKARQEAKPPLRVAKKTVLLVHADVPARSALERMLTDTQAYQVETATTGAAALSRAGEAHLVIVDASLPDAHPLDLCRWLHSHWPSVPVFLLSSVHRGWRFAQDAGQALGIAAYVEKPIKSNELLRRIAATLGQVPADTPGLSYARKHLKKGMAALLRGELPEARAAFLRGLELDPASDLLHYYAGTTFEKLEQPFEAIDHYEEAVRLNPEFEDALVLLAGLYDRNGFRLKSVEIWERALEVTRDEESRATLKAHIADLLELDQKGAPSRAA